MPNSDILNESRNAMINPGPTPANSQTVSPITQPAADIQRQENPPVKTENSTLSTSAMDAIPKYDGTSKIDDFLDTVDASAVFFGLTPVQTKYLVMIKLTGKAKEFLNSHLALKRDGSWQQLRDGLKSRFQERPPLGHADNKFQNCKQQTKESVIDFSERLRGYGVKTVKYGDDEQRNHFLSDCLRKDFLRIFLAGLNEDVRRSVLMAEPQTFEDAIFLAEKAERVEKALKVDKQVAVNELQRPPRETFTQKRNNYPRDRSSFPMRKFQSAYVQDDRRVPRNDAVRTNMHYNNAIHYNRQGHSHGFAYTPNREGQGTHLMQARASGYAGRQYRSDKTAHAPHRNINRSYQQRTFSQQGYARNENNQTGACFRCGNRGHWANSCPANVRKCNKCNRPGHDANHCRSKDNQASRYVATLNEEIVASETQEVAPDNQ